MNSASNDQRPGLALQLYTVRDALARDRARTLSRIRQLGFDSVETAGIRHELPSFADRVELSEYGLNQIGSYFAGDLSRFESYLDAEAEAGNGVVVLGLGASYFADVGSVSRAVTELNRMAGECSMRGMRLGYHNHDWEVNDVGGGQSALEILVRELRPDIFLQFDFYWAQVGGLSATSAGEIAGSRIARLHLKDGPVTHDPVMSLFGEGAFDLAAAAAQAPKAEWHIIAFDEFDGDLLEASGIDLRFLVKNNLSVAATADRDH